MKGSRSSTQLRKSCAWPEHPGENTKSFPETDPEVEGRGA